MIQIMKPCIMSLAYLIEPGTTVRDMFDLLPEEEILKGFIVSE